jgi:hypothetical protein
LTVVTFQEDMLLDKLGIWRHAEGGEKKEEEEEEEEEEEDTKVDRCDAWTLVEIRRDQQPLHGLHP